MKRGDIVLLVAQGNLGKPRPGIVVQSDELGETSSTILVCPLSSDLREFRRTRPEIEPSSTNGLLLRSQIMTDKVSALRRNQIRRVVGSLDRETTDRLNSALLTVLGLTRSA